ncbi:MAG: ATP-binding cassette domain-containing protein [Chloroflexota bacterium]
MATQPLLELKGVSKRFGAVQALYQVDFSATEGEVMALVGDNGAGKSTLVKGIAGIYNYDEGEVHFDGKRVNINSPKDSANLGIEVVYQDLALADNLDVVANMFLGREITRKPEWAKADNRVLKFLSTVAEVGYRRMRHLDETAMERQTIETLDSLSVSTLRSVRLPVASLSGGQRQAIAVAKAVMWNSRVVILDEPTAALGVAQTRQVLDLVRRLADKGLAVVIITHNLHDVFEVTDKITVLRLGQKVNEFVTADTNRQEVVESITAGQLKTVPGMQEDIA